MNFTKCYTAGGANLVGGNEVFSYQRVSVPADVLLRQVAGEAVILNLATETYFGLDEIGTSMWWALTTCESVQHAYQSLLDEFDVDPEVLRTDLTRLLEELVNHGLVELNPA